MDSWVKLIQMAEETTRCAKLAEDNLKAAAYYWRLKHEPTEKAVCPIKEGAIKCERGGLYNERPYVQLQPGDDSSLSFQHPKARKRHKYQG